MGVSSFARSGVIGAPRRSIDSLSPVSGLMPEISPDAVSGLVGWWAARRETGFANLDPVGQLTDWSGNDFHFLQGSAAAKPTFLTNQKNGHPGVDFDGSGDFMQCADFPWKMYKSLFVVCNFTTAEPFFLEQSASAVTNPGFFLFAGAGSVIDRQDGDKFLNLAGQANWGGSTFALLEFHYDGTAVTNGTINLFRNAVGISNGSVSSNNIDSDITVTDTLNLCSRNGASLFQDGTLCELIAYDGRVSAGNIALIRGYLNNLYALY